MNNYVVNQLLAESTDAKFVERKSQELSFFLNVHIHTASSWNVSLKDYSFYLYLHIHTASLWNVSLKIFLFFLYLHTHTASCLWKARAGLKNFHLFLHVYVRTAIWFNAKLKKGQIIYNENMQSPFWGTSQTLDKNNKANPFVL